MNAALEWTPADGSVIIVPRGRSHGCSKCGGPKDKPGQRYCKRCHATYMRAWRSVRETVVKQNVHRETFPDRPETVSGTETRQIELGGGLFALVDAEDYEWLRQWKWHAGRGGYAVRVEAGKSVVMHREILQTPDGMETDHVDRNRTNNVRANLRVATRSQNTANSVRSDCKSGYKGVSWHRRAERWVATANTNGKQVYIGLFDDSVDAARAYDKRARELYGEFAYLNFPLEASA